MLRLVRLVDGIAAAALAFVTALTFVSVLGRYLLGIQIPDNFDFARLITGIVIIWGFATIGHDDEHIQMDAFATALPPGAKRIVEAFALLVTMAYMTLLAVLLAGRVHNDYLDQTGTFNLGVEVWPFHLVAWVGMAAAAALLMIRSVRLLLGIPHERSRQSDAYHG